jgi:hypothetical protein
MWSVRIALALGVPLAACSCIELGFDALVQNRVIFIGEVIEGGIQSTREDPWYSESTHVRFRVLERFRGVKADTETLDMQVAPPFGMCSPNPYHLGKRYLVVPGELNGKLFDGICFTGRDVDRAADLVQDVREYFAGSKPAKIEGQAAIGRSGLIDFLLYMGEARPAEGARIIAVQGRRTYSTTADARGRYKLLLPSGGKYTVRAEMPLHQAEDPVVIEIKDKGSAVIDFAFSINNTISGRVLDPEGHPVRSARVGLIDIDHEQPKGAHPWLDDAYMENHGLFEFKNVPMGRYLLVFNPEGPQTGSEFKLPFESTYYPLVSSRADAKIIPVNSDNVHWTGMDIIIGKRVEFREAIVTVKYPDGQTMRTADVHFTGLPLQPGQDVWAQRRPFLSTMDSVRLFVPADRTIRIEVKDAYGRDLGAIHSSTHEAGEAPIRQDFVIQP